MARLEGRGTPFPRQGKREAWEASRSRVALRRIGSSRGAIGQAADRPPRTTIPASPSIKCPARGLLFIPGQQPLSSPAIWSAGIWYICCGSSASTLCLPGLRREPEMWRVCGGARHLPAGRMASLPRVHKPLQTRPGLHRDASARVLRRGLVRDAQKTTLACVAQIPGKECPGIPK